MAAPPAPASSWVSAAGTQLPRVFGVREASWSDGSTSPSLEACGSRWVHQGLQGASGSEIFSQEDFLKAPKTHGSPLQSLCSLPKHSWKGMHRPLP